MADFDSVLREWYEGELAGAEAFDLLADAAEDDEARKWSLLGRLERATAERLRAACTDASVPLGETPPDSSLLEYAKPMVELPWQTNMEGLAPQIEKAVNEIRAQADEAPPAHAEISRDFTAHEEALLAFVRLELEGKDGSPAVESLLKAWSAE